MNRYRVSKAPDDWPESLPFRIGWPGHDADYGVGEEFEAEWSVEEEAEKLSSGLVEIVPRLYHVVGGSEVLGHVASDPPFEAAIPKGQEELLLDYHLERVEQEPAPKSKRKASADKGA